MADTLIVVPTYNELHTIESIVARIRAAVPHADVLVVDDNSPDGTGKKADGLATADARVDVLHRDRKQGLGRAYLDAFALALARGYRLIVEIDADGSHDPAELPAMLALIDAGNDLVLGSRNVPGGRVQNWPRIRQLISRTGNRYARLMLHTGITDLTSGFRVYRAEVLSVLDFATVSSQGYSFQIEMAWRSEQAGFRVVEHPIVFVERENDTSKMRLGIVVEALMRVTGWGIRRVLQAKRSG